MPAAGVASGFDIDQLISRRAKSVDASGIRKVFDLAAKMKDPINLSIGQPDFPVPESMKQAAIDAIRQDRNGYTVTQGIQPLLEAIWQRLHSEVGWTPHAHGTGVDMGALVTSGTSGGLLLAFLSLLDAGDEAIVPDPYFVLYPQLATLTGGTIVTCDTYPDFRMTAERVERLMTPRTKAVLLNSPSNPCGVVMTEREIKDLVDLCVAKGVLLVSDEIYDEFVFADAKENGRFPTPARYTRDCLLIRGFGKTYGCTGWRLGYAAGPHALIQAMARFQQYTYVCAPSITQWGVLPAFAADMSGAVAQYEGRRDLVLEAFRGVTEVARPGGAFYAFVEVPHRLGMTASEFVERAIENRVLVIPGKVFSHRDTHFRLSFATAEAKLREGLGILRGLMS
ncbi:MAG: aminotransferase class I/II-fold pyridoxal phosphate-dependent enzyme [Phycisphaerae bacterium]|nr:aminotransferase class I/II-fold pyridoxal phosphate-dependent enzyme [Phycisphaerae bacterium]